MNTPYTYLIGWSVHNLWYYGCQYGTKSSPENLWKTYFTSSKVVKDLRVKLGEPDVIQIRKTFDSNLAALNWESRVLGRLDAANNTKWLNQHNSNGKFNVTLSQRWSSDQSRIEQSKVMKNLWQDPVFKQAWSEKQTLRWQNEDKSQDAEQKRQRLSRPEHKSALQEGYANFWSDPENKQRHSDQLRERHKINREKKPVLADGILYKSIHVCAEHYDRSVKWVRSQIKKGNFEIKLVE